MGAKQVALKKQAYASELKSRALSVLIYLIDRSNQELTCFPAISTMARELHISESTVKRALRELTERGYIKKEVRFREKNLGQTSNLYTLLFLESQKDVATDEESTNTVTMRDEESRSVTEKSVPIETISFAILQAEALERELSQEEIGYAQKIQQVQKMQKITLRKVPFGLRQGKMILKGEIKQQQHLKGQETSIFLESGDHGQALRFFWPGEGVNLIPP